MLRGFVIGGALLLACFVSVPEPANAGTRIGVTIGGGWVPVYPDDGDDDYYISCGEGRRIVRDDGFWSVRPMKCGGEIYRYEAVRRDRLWSVRVSARSGRIISARVIDDYRDYY